MKTNYKVEFDVETDAGKGLLKQYIIWHLKTLKITDIKVKEIKCAGQ